MTKHTDTSRSGDLVERLRSRVSNRELLLVDPPRPAPDHLCHEAADRIEALEAALRDLVEAVHRRTIDLGGYDGRFGLNKSITKARAALGEKQ